jgi:hypothetical protein
MIYKTFEIDQSCLCLSLSCQSSESIILVTALFQMFLIHFLFLCPITLSCIFLTISIYAIGLWRVYEPAPTMLESFTMKIFPSRWLLLQLLAGFPKSYDKTDYGRKNPLSSLTFECQTVNSILVMVGQRDIKHTIGWHIKWRRKRMA